VHRDIKPANLMIDKGNHVKVTDFGIARVRGASRDTRDGMIIGTYEYISPEAAQGLEATALSDVYSMGVVLFEILTGRLPFESRNEFELLRLHIQAPGRACGRSSKTCRQPWTTSSSGRWTGGRGEGFARPRRWPMRCRDVWTAASG